ncbi:Protein flp [Phycisphaerales bacterium]|nr:Protein flp [Phycisphaerales bacterium]
MGYLILGVAAALIGGTSPAAAGMVQPPPAAAATEPPRDITSILEPIIAKHKVPGMAAAVIQGDRIVMLGAAGVRAAGHPEKATESDLWHIGSCTKSMTATLCAQLIEDGRLNWNTTLEQGFPELAERMNPKWKRVTLTQLLTHRAGVPHNLDQDGLWGRVWNSNETPAKLRLMIAEYLLTHEPGYEPGTKYEYANAGYTLAGILAERAGGEPWESLIQRRLFAPVGITSAGFGAPGVPVVISQPRGHNAAGAPVEPSHDADNPAGIGPGGTVHLTISDWAKYIAIHLRGDKENPRRATRLLGPESYDALHTPPAGDYACGWSITQRPWGEGRVLNHNGSNTMWFAVTWLAPKRDFAVLVACNIGGDAGSSGADEAVGAMIREIQRGAPAKGSP